MNAVRHQQQVLARCGTPDMSKVDKFPPGSEVTWPIWHGDQVTGGRQMKALSRNVVGQVWSLHEEAGTRWVVSNGTYYAVPTRILAVVS